MSEWREYRLEDVVSLHRGFDLPFRARRPGPYPVLSAGMQAGTHAEARIKGPGFVIGRATNLGVPTWTDTDYWPLNTTLYAADFKGNDPRFLYHLFENLNLSGYDSGSVQPMLNRNYIGGIKIRIPCLHTQRAIAEVMRALDDKISGNDGMIAKSSDLMLALAATGSFTTGLHRIAMLDKRTTTPSSLGELRVSHFSLPAFDLGRMPDVGPASSIRSNKLVIVGPCVLVSKLNPRWPRIWDVIESGPQVSLASTEFLVLKPVSCASSVLWAVLSQPSFASSLQSKVAGASGSHQRVKPDEVMNTEVINPASITEQRREQIVTLGRIVSERRTESRLLARTRDTLLPLLMTGKIRVKEAEEVVQGAV